MIVDTSAVVAVLADEDDSYAFASALVRAGRSTLSAGTYLECAIVLDSNSDPLVGRGLDHFLLESNVAITSVTPEQARIARAAYRDFGRGSGHAARLNFGDCFAYALAIDRGEPLLYKGDDFAHTDVRSALAE